MTNEQIKDIFMRYMNESLAEELMELYDFESWDKEELDQFAYDYMNNEDEDKITAPDRWTQTDENFQFWNG